VCGEVKAEDDCVCASRYLENYDGSYEYNSTACRELRQEIMDVKGLTMWVVVMTQREVDTFRIMYFFPRGDAHAPIRLGRHSPRLIDNPNIFSRHILLPTFNTHSQRVTRYNILGAAVAHGGWAVVPPQGTRVWSPLSLHVEVSLSKTLTPRALHCSAINN